MEEYTLSQIRPDDAAAMAQLRALLAQQGLTLDQNLDYTCGLFDRQDRLLATGSTFGATLRCFAVDSRLQGQGLLGQLLSHLAGRQTARGFVHQFVYTKAPSARFFQDLGFYEIARTEGGVSFLENRPDGFSSYCARLSQSRRPGSSAAIVMNANPFTLGHRYLVEQAAAQADTVHLFVLSEEQSLVPFWARWQLVTRGVCDLPGVLCHPSGPYMISSATFPSYFLQEQAQVITAHAQLDVALFGPIARALGVTARFVGEEPFSQVTGLYNQVMAQSLPGMGIRFVQLPRRQGPGGAISASRVRQAIHEGRLQDIRAMVPPVTWEFFHSPQAQPVIQAIRQSDQVIHY